MYGHVATQEQLNGQRLDQLATESAQKQALGGRWLPHTFTLADNAKVRVLVGPREPPVKPDSSAP